MLTCCSIEFLVLWPNRNDVKHGFVWSAGLSVWFANVSICFASDLLFDLLWKFGKSIADVKFRLSCGIERVSLQIGTLFTLTNSSLIVISSIPYSKLLNLTIFSAFLWWNLPVRSVQRVYWFVCYKVCVRRSPFGLFHELSRGDGSNRRNAIGNARSNLQCNFKTMKRKIIPEKLFTNNFKRLHLFASMLKEASSTPKQTSRKHFPFDLLWVSNFLLLKSKLSR